MVGRFDLRDLPLLDRDLDRDRAAQSFARCAPGAVLERAAAESKRGFDGRQPVFGALDVGLPFGREPFDRFPYFFFRIILSPRRIQPVYP